MGFFALLLFSGIFQIHVLCSITPQANLSLWPLALDNPGHNYNQQDPYDFSTPQNSGFSSLHAGQDWYHQYRKLVLYNTNLVMLQGKIIKITQEDIAQIDPICADNYHKSFDDLRIHLAQSSVFNAAQNFFEGDNLLHAFSPDIFIFVKDHDIENHVPDDDRPGLTNETNSCTISYENFIEFREKWITLKQELPPFAIMYRDDNDWVDCKGFESQEAMEQFVADQK